MSSSASSDEYVNLVSVRGRPRHRRHAGRAQGRAGITMIDDLDVDLPPARHLLVVRNDDRPMDVAAVTSALAEASINIDDMRVGHDPDGAAAMQVIATTPEVRRRCRTGCGALTASCRCTPSPTEAHTSGMSSPGPAAWVGQPSWQEPSWRRPSWRAPPSPVPSWPVPSWRRPSGPVPSRALPRRTHRPPRLRRTYRPLRSWSVTPLAAALRGRGGRRLDRAPARCVERRAASLEQALDGIADGDEQLETDQQAEQATHGGTVPA